MRRARPPQPTPPAASAGLTVERDVDVDALDALDAASLAFAEPVAPPPPAIRGRGASSNAAGRYETRRYDAVDDGWAPIGDGHGADEPATPPPRAAATAAPLAAGLGAATTTQVRPLATRKAMSRNDSPDIPFDRAVNPYRGCEHGCIYCFARPDHAYLGHSPGLDFEQIIFAKHDVAAALAKEWAAPSYRPEVLAIGASTDPYQPVEAELGLTRALLELALKHRHPVALVTKSTRILRDLDVLRALAELELVRVFVSVTSLDAALQRKLEPRAAAPSSRLRIIATLADAGVSVGVLAAPMIPAVNDHELEAILDAARAAGAASAGWILLRLPREVAPLFDDWLQAWLPERRERVLDLLRGARGGKLYDATFGRRMRGDGPYAALLARRFEIAKARLGFPASLPPLRTDRFVAPVAAGGGRGGRQLTLL